MTTPALLKAARAIWDRGRGRTTTPSFDLLSDSQRADLIADAAAAISTLLGRSRAMNAAVRQVLGEPKALANDTPRGSIRRGSNRSTRAMRDPGDPFEPRIAGICDEPTCCAPIAPARRSRREDQPTRFCSDACRNRYRNRAIKRGYRLYEVVARWREAPRCHQKGAVNQPTNFGDVTAVIDEYLRRDRELREAARAANSR